MAKTTITHSCGHDQVHDLLGPYTGRERRAESLQAGVCSDCWRTQARAKQAAALVRAEESGLPTLAGTPKQIAWATTIRQGHLDALESKSAEIAHTLGLTTGVTEMVRACLLHQTDSRWWIDQRGFSTSTLAQVAVNAAWLATGLPVDAIKAAMTAGFVPADAQSAYESDPEVVAAWRLISALTRD